LAAWMKDHPERSTIRVGSCLLETSPGQPSGEWKPSEDDRRDPAGHADPPACDCARVSDRLVRIVGDIPDQPPSPSVQTTPRRWGNRSGEQSPARVPPIHPTASGFDRLLCLAEPEATRVPPHPNIACEPSIAPRTLEVEP